MKLYMVPCTQPHKVMLYIAEREELGVQMSIEQIVVNTVKGRHKEPEHLARNPFGTVPALELDDGTYLVESLAMIDFVKINSPTKGCTGAAQKRKVRRGIWSASSTCDWAAPWAPLVMPPTHHWVAPEPEKAAQYLESMQTPLDYLENLLGDGRELLCGNHVNVADCTLQSFLQFTRFVEAHVFGDRPLLRAWDERYRARPAAQAVLKW